MLSPGSKSDLLDFNTAMICQTSFTSTPVLKLFSSCGTKIDQIFLQVLRCDNLIDERGV